MKALKSVFREVTGLFVEDGSYLRGKNIRLDYNVPSAWLGGRAARTGSARPAGADLRGRDALSTSARQLGRRANPRRTLSVQKSS